MRLDGRPLATCRKRAAVAHAVKAQVGRLSRSPDEWWSAWGGRLRRYLDAGGRLVGRRSSLTVVVGADSGAWHPTASVGGWTRPPGGLTAGRPRTTAGRGDRGGGAGMRGRSAGVTAGCAVVGSAGELSKAIVTRLTLLGRSTPGGLVAVVELEWSPPYIVVVGSVGAACAAVVVRPPGYLLGRWWPESTGRWTSRPDAFRVLGCGRVRPDLRFAR